MDIFLQILIIIASILLTFLVFIQNPKGGGLSSDFGSAQQLGGVQKTNDFVVKGTWSLAAVIMLFSIVLTLRNKPAKPVVQEKAQTQQQDPATPNPNNGGKP